MMPGISFSGDVVCDRRIEISPYTYTILCTYSITAQTESGFVSEDVLHSIVIQSLQLRYYSKLRRLWVDDNDSARNELNDCNCPSAGRLSMVWIDTEDCCESASWLWMTDIKIVGAMRFCHTTLRSSLLLTCRGQPEPDCRVIEFFLSEHFFTVKSKQPTTHWVDRKVYVIPMILLLSNSDSC